MPFLTRLFLFAWLSVFASEAIARNYIVEVVVFERTRDTEQREEQWRPDSNLVINNQANLQALAQRSKTPTTMSATSRLKRLESALLGSGNRIVQSARWVLNARTYQNATTFNLSTGNLRAFLKIYKTSLIFADLNMGLIASAPATEVNSTSGFTTANSYQPPAPLFFINEKRRLKFKEIHYFDHPKFGVILGVWPAG